MRGRQFSVFLLIGLLGGCTAPDGMRYKMTASAPATTSLQQAYTDLIDEMWSDTKEVVAMDRYKHGIRPALDTIPSQKATQEVAFDHYDSMYFKVYKVEVVDQYSAPVSTDYNEHLPVTASDAVHSWANRLRPTGGVNKLQVVIRDARMAPTDGGYDVSLAIDMRICSRDGKVLASISSSAVQSALVAGKDYDSRKAALNAMLLKLIDSANTELENKLAKNFSPFMERAKAV